jgi:hypothetical protein
MSETVNLALPLIAAAQSQKHVTHNEALAIGDALIHLAVLSRMLASPPASPLDGERYLIAAGADGLWSTHDGELAFYLDGVWRFATPRAGWRLWSVAEEKLFVFDGSLWRDVQNIDELQDMELLGINTTADAANRLAVASANVLFTHEGSDQRVKINKNAVGDTASFLFQTNYSGRAEIGLAGDDDFHFKVSPDGISWQESFVIAREDGGVSFALGAMREQVDKFTASGTWTKPLWARRVHVVAISGRGGGGSGATRGTGVADGGGGGGSGGTVVEAWFSAHDLDGTVAVTVGAGGTGGAGVATNDTNGNAGTIGGTSQFGSYLKSVADTTGNGGAGTASGGTAGTHTAARDMPPGVGGAAGAGGTGAAGSSAPNGGGKQPSGGGGGGGISAANAVFNGGNSGFGALGSGAATQSLGGTAPGGNGGGGIANARIYLAGGDGGGGGASAVAANGGNGGDGGVPGGGGGGGGAARNGFTSGAGGNGGRGEVWVVSIG